MNVVHLCHLPLPESHPDFGSLYSHPGRWVLNLALAQQRHTEVTPTLLIQVPGATRDHYCEVEGIPCHFVKIPNQFRATTLFEFDRRFLSKRALEFSPDLVHAHGTEEAYGLAAQTTGKPYIITAQGLFSQINHVMPPKLISRSRVIEVLENRCLRRTQDIIAKSTYVADWIRQKYPHLKINHIPNTFDPRLLEITPPSKSANSLAFVGTICPRKGLHLISDALAHDSTLTLMIGSLEIFGNSKSPSEYEQNTLEKLRHTLREKLILHGTVSTYQMIQKLAKCETLIAPSLEEMFGNQVIEALLVGTYPIVSSHTAMAENVTKIGIGSIFQNTDSADLADKIMARLSSKEPLVDITSSRSRLMSFMGQKKVADQHLELYHTLC